MASEDTKDLAIAPPSLAKLIVGPLALLAMGSVWGLGFALSKVAGEAGAHPVGLIIWETLGSGSLLLLVCAMLGRYPRPQWLYLRNYVINGLLGFTIPGPILFWAAPHLPVAVLTLMIPMAPLLTYVLILFSSVVTGTAEYWSMERTSAGDRKRYCARIRAAVPATSGEDMDVPLQLA